MLNWQYQGNFDHRPLQKDFVGFITSLNPRASKNTLVLLICENGSQPGVVLAPGEHPTTPGDILFATPVGGGRGSCWTSDTSRDTPTTKNHLDQKVNSAGVEKPSRHPSSFGEIHI